MSQVGRRRIGEKRGEKMNERTKGLCPLWRRRAAMLQTARGGEEDEWMHGRALSDKAGEGYVRQGGRRLCPR